MLIHVTTIGGLVYLPQLAGTVTLDTGKFSAADEEKLKRLLEQSDFFNQPDVTAPPPVKVPDVFSYLIQVEAGEKRHGVGVQDTENKPGLIALVAFLRARIRELR